MNLNPPLFDFAIILDVYPPLSPPTLHPWPSCPTIAEFRGLVSPLLPVPFVQAPCLAKARVRGLPEERGVNATARLRANESDF